MLNSIVGLLSGGVAAGDYESIATATGSGASSVTFSSIPATYQHLQIRALVRMASGTSGLDNMGMQINSDTTNANYASHYLSGDGATASSSSFITSYPIILRNAVPRNGSTASVFGTLIIDILDYANTNKNKTVRTLLGTDINGTGNIALTSGVWLNSGSAITTIKLYDYDNNAYNFDSNCSFALYGIKG